MGWFGLAPAPGEEPTGEQKHTPGYATRFTPEERKAMDALKVIGGKPADPANPPTMQEGSDDATDWQ